MQEEMTQVKTGARSARTAIATALLVAVLGLGAFGVRGGFAQETTPTADETEATTATTEDADATAAYDEFVAGLAANLGIDSPTVDAAITQTFTDMVAAKLAAGEISADAAAELTERIIAGEVPLGLGWLGGGHGGMGGFDGPGDRGNRGGRMPGADRPDDASDDAMSEDDAVGGGTTEDLDPAGTPAAVN